ncbi:hypothetical protein HMPREF0673_02711 [Leyella stercorea DSM 18206]|uniref:Uncharacterized protein n=1 Tax=Leyella stercorea DSM 18206 TaxID=1002367 RepID=G6B1E0_9BACT|nr:hypothetical protein HMPREF0673_02711 [Leyella stercorea DSM 18206]
MYIRAICGRIYAARKFCEICEFRGIINVGARVLGWCSGDR